MRHGNCHLPAYANGDADPVGTLTFVRRAIKRIGDGPLSPAPSQAVDWQKVEAEPPGFVVINRYRESPHPRVTFAADFSKRLEPQPGMKVVYARATIRSETDHVKRLSIGYSDHAQRFPER